MLWIIKIIILEKIFIEYIKKEILRNEEILKVNNIDILGLWGMLT